MAEHIKKKITRAISLAGLVLVSLIVAIFLSEAILRFTVLKNREYENEAVRFTMQNLQADKDVGFLWKGGLDIAKEKNPGWYDQEKFPLITDDKGYFNTREAIDRKRRKERINIVGIGDSFMHRATYGFYEFFKEKGLFYYNMAMSRQCPPQYNIILTRDALPLKPDLIVYGLYENDFNETPDFENWQASGLDWFTYHSGTWFGPAVKLSPRREFMGKFFPGFSELEKRIRRQFNLSRVLSQRLPGKDLGREKETQKVYNYIEEAYKNTVNAGVSFLCIIIPVRDVNASGYSPRDSYYGIVLNKLRQGGIPTLDLRPVFNAYPERQDLYYKLDAHWNGRGVGLAAENIYKALLRDRSVKIEGLERDPEKAAEKQAGSFGEN